ncbi:MAG: head GIN domain-containing protein [Bacteroidota bacterium]
MKTSNILLTGFAGSVLLAGLALLLFVRANLVPRHTIQPSGDVITTTRDVAPFTDLNIKGRYHVELSKTAQGLTIEGDKSFVDKMIIEENNGQLSIKTNREHDYDEKHIVKLTLGYDQLQRINNSTTGYVYSKEVLTGDRLDLRVNGAASTELELDVAELNIDVNGAGQAILKGKANQLEAEIGGASHLRAGELIATHADVQTNGASHARVNATSSISLEADGASDLRYSGAAEVRSISNSGSSRIRKVD